VNSPIYSTIVSGYHTIIFITFRKSKYFVVTYIQPAKLNNKFLYWSSAT